MGKQPWMKFWIDDWLTDARVQSCSLAARGLWLEMLLRMHRSERPGFLVLNGRQIDAKSFAKLIASDRKSVAKSWCELQANGVFSVTPDGIVYCRKMLRDMDLSQVRSAAGRKGAEHLLKQKQSKCKTHAEALPQQTSASASASASTEGVQGEIAEIFEAYPNPVGRRAALGAIAGALRRVAARNGVRDPAGWLLERVRAYARSRAAEDPRYTPTARTWFREDRYDDPLPGEASAPCGGLSPECRRILELPDAD